MDDADSFTAPSPTHDVDHYLALEREIAVACAPGEERVMIWSVGPSVICGRNQDIPAEVDLDYCRDNGIKVFRRHSGGGAVYADRGNLMISFITRSADDVPTTFARWVERLAATLRSLGIEAVATGHNDIEVKGRKVSGGAFYLTPDGASIAHSTMLYDTDMTHMCRALTPPALKLARHGVTSVPARIGLLKDYTPLTLNELHDALRGALVADEVDLNSKY